MPRARLPQLHSIADGSFEPSRNNPIALRDDEPLDEHFKPIKVGGKNSAIELADDSLRVSGNLVADRIKGDVNINDGNLNIDEGFKLRFDSESALAGWQSGNSYIYVEDDTMYFYVGGEKLLTIAQETGLGSNDKITTFTSDLSLDEGQKLFFEGMSSDSYLHRTTGDIYEFYGDNTKLLSINDNGAVTIEAGNLYFENGEYISNSSNNQITSYLDNGNMMFSSNSTEFVVADKLMLDAHSGHTYIHEASDDQLSFVVGDTEMLRIIEDTTNSLYIPSGTHFYFDGGGDTYIEESSADVLDIRVGGDIIFQITESGDDGNTIDIDNACIGFTQLEPTYDATDTLVDFRLSNKHFLTFGIGNITNLQLRFPLVSGNFVLLVKQDGTGSRTITNYKAQEFDESAADGSTSVKFAGGSNPTLTTDANHVDILSFYWDADNEIAYGVATLDFQF